MVGEVGGKDYLLRLPDLFVDKAHMRPDGENRTSSAPEDAFRIRSPDELADPMSAVSRKHDNIGLAPGSFAVDHIPEIALLHNALVTEVLQARIGGQFLHLGLALLKHRIQLQRNGFHWHGIQRLCRCSMYHKNLCGVVLSDGHGKLQRTL